MLTSTQGCSKALCKLNNKYKQHHIIICLSPAGLSRDCVSHDCMPTLRALHYYVVKYPKIKYMYSQRDVLFDRYLEHILQYVVREIWDRGASFYQKS